MGIYRSHDLFKEPSQVVAKFKEIQCSKMFTKILSMKSAFTYFYIQIKSPNDKNLLR